MPEKTSRATLIGLIAILLWGCSLGLLRSVTSHLGVLLGSALIFTCASFFSLLFQGLPNLKNYNIRYLKYCGTIFVTYEIVLLLAIGKAHTHLQSIELGMVNYLWPSLTILFAVPILKQRINALLVGGMVLSLLGIGAIIQSGQDWSMANMLQNIQGNPVAYLLALCAAMLWAFYNNLVRKFNNTGHSVLPFLATTAALFWLGWLFMPEQQAPVWNIRSISELLCLGLFMSIAYNVWNFGMQKGNMLILTLASYFTPALSAFIASLLLQTLPSDSFWLGLGMLIIGALICWGASKLKHH